MKDTTMKDTTMKDTTKITLTVGQLKKLIKESTTSDFEIKDGVLIKYRGPGGAVVIPDNVTSIAGDFLGDSAFGGCETVTSVTIPDSVKKIGNNAFYGCTNLKSVVIGNGVTEIDFDTFKDCKNLTSVKIPSSVTNISATAFSGCDSLFDTTTVPGFQIVDGWVIRCNASVKGDVDLSNFRGIAESSFWECTKITSVTLPNGIEKIPFNSFCRCTKLTTVKGAGSVKKVGERAFALCTHLSSIDIPDGIIVEEDAFYRCTALPNAPKCNVQPDELEVKDDTPPNENLYTIHYTDNSATMNRREGGSSIRDYEFEGTLQEVLNFGAYSMTEGLGDLDEDEFKDAVKSGEWTMLSEKDAINTMDSADLGAGSPVVFWIKNYKNRKVYNSGLQASDFR